MGPKANSQPLCMAPESQAGPWSLPCEQLGSERGQESLAAKCPLYSARTQERRRAAPLLGQAPTLGSQLLFFLLSNFHCPLYPLGSVLELQKPYKCPCFFFAAPGEVAHHHASADPSLGATWPA